MGDPCEKAPLVMLVRMAQDSGYAHMHSEPPLRMSPSTSQSENSRRAGLFAPTHIQLTLTVVYAITVHNSRTATVHYTSPNTATGQLAVDRAHARPLWLEIPHSARSVRNAVPWWMHGLPRRGRTAGGTRIGLSPHRHAHLLHPLGKHDTAHSVVASTSR